MWKRIGVVLLWTLATIGTASITLAAVGRVGEQVTTQAAVPIDSDELLASPAVQALSNSTTSTAVTTTTDAPPSSQQLPDDTSTSTVDDQVTSTTIAPPSTTTTAAASTSSTTAATGGQTVVRSLVGGTVTVWFEGSTVSYVSAVPAAGGLWTVAVKNYGPQQVIVEFESDDHESKYRARVQGGELIIDIDEGRDD